MLPGIGPFGLAIAGVGRDGRRRYDPAGKERLIDACLRPGVSLAGLALQHGVNANLLRKWVARRRLRPEGSEAGIGVAQLPGPGAFVRVEASPVAKAPGAGSLTLQSAQALAPARFQATMPNGVMVSLEGCDAQLLSVMIDALGRCDVPSVG